MATTLADGLIFGHFGGYAEVNRRGGGGGELPAVCAEIFWVCMIEVVRYIPVNVYKCSRMFFYNTQLIVIF